MDRRDLGRTGEDIAVSYLVAEGYRILKRNFRYRRYEIDIIAGKPGLLVFIEVKTRSSREFGDPILSITPSKKRHILTAAKAYIEMEDHRDRDVRFDVLTLMRLGTSFRIDHLEDAFRCGL